MSLSGKTVVVTGAAGAMGMAVVRTLLEGGAKVALVDVDALRWTASRGSCAARSWPCPAT
jgi:NAD(P)-dependent dehydrogenase (short-subunit alcohol dehydrogenase family)